MNLTNIDEWFPLEQQRKYVSQMQGQVGLTRRRAEYFVKLWGYLLIKQQQELGKPLKTPLTQLEIPEGFISCTHREAQELFYGAQDRGSDRAAGMMLDKLSALGLIEKNFDGNTTCIRIRFTLPHPINSAANTESFQLIPDAFNPRTDTIPVATFLVRYYNWINKKNTVVPHRIAKILRAWSNEYPTGMRVLRRSDTQNPVGFYALYPVASESEENFFLPPRKSLFLNSDMEIDPMQMAKLGDINCNAVHLRAWQIDFPYKQPINLLQMLKDAKNTLVMMQSDFPNLCDIYTLPLHPIDQQLASLVGFQKTASDPQMQLYWMYMPFDKYISLDIEQSLSYLING
ncbi:hypothetical protein [Calothrix sp. PCC 6303]|uniref:hypothetical protein n=1 Tax=Calothrix sp. PCC 6303 TaxID=1170562 RepID=UPI0002A03707|nr:hypothetical protein [Calothrix sp. PCC 6303]AFY99782.1 hypothetical protein Cal6303_0712 [Calothrix sp. PCC 6303]